jgi:uncharacterized protein (DUF1697 family)
MALVAFLKGINVGGHRRFRPSALAKELEYLDVVNIGAAGTFVVRSSITEQDLRSAIVSRASLATDVMICTASEILGLISDHPFDGSAPEPNIVQFVSVFSKGGKTVPPFSLPSDTDWSLKVLKCQRPFVIGLHKREMKAITHLHQLEKAIGAPMTTRSWSTILKIASVLKPDAG